MCAELPGPCGGQPFVGQAEATKWSALEICAKSWVAIRVESIVEGVYSLCSKWLDTCQKKQDSPTETPGTQECEHQQKKCGRMGWKGRWMDPSWPSPLADFEAKFIDQRTHPKESRPEGDRKCERGLGHAARLRWCELWSWGGFTSKPISSGALHWTTLINQRRFRDACLKTFTYHWKFYSNHRPWSWSGLQEGFEQITCQRRWGRVESSREEAHTKINPFEP